MELKAYLKSLPDEAAREGFAQRVGVTLGHLRNVSYGLRPCAPELATTVEIESAGAVTRQELCPSNWQRIWPELVHESAPAHAPEQRAA